MLQARLLLSALVEGGVDFIVIGGMAAVAQGSAYVTADLDLCYRRDEDNHQRRSDALRRFRPELRGAPSGLPFRLDGATRKAGLNFTLTTTAGDIDLLGEVAGLGSYDAVKQHAETVELFDHEIWILTIDGLIRAKLAAGRPKDLLLVTELEALRALRDRLDPELP